MDKCLISLCMIVKNEEKFLPDCLQSVQGVVDEIILVDTGSTDATIEIATKFGAKIIHHKWKNDFAEARNVSLKAATGEWILMLDADESLDLDDRKHIRPYIEQTKSPMLALELINYHGEEKDEHKTFTMAQSRLFRNHLDLYFENSIHETINLNNRDFDVDAIPHIPVRIHHMGYLAPITKIKKKNERNMRLLHEEIKKKDHSPWMEYHLAGEYYRQQKFDIAFQYCNECIMGFLISKLMPPSLVYNLKYSCLVSTRSFKETLKSIDKAIQLFPDYVDLHFYKGISLYYEEMYNEAILTFDHCLSLGDKNLKYLVMSGTGTYQALYFQALCFKKQGNDEKCRELLEEAIRIYPAYEEALQELHALAH
jgi:glycosyltransferase involved in cell wall biosynthesis